MAGQRLQLALALAGGPVSGSTYSYDVRAACGRTIVRLWLRAERLSSVLGYLAACWATEAPLRSVRIVCQGRAPAGDWRPTCETMLADTGRAPPSYRVIPRGDRGGPFDLELTH